MALLPQAADLGTIMAPKQEAKCSRDVKSEHSDIVSRARGKINAWIWSLASLKTHNHLVGKKKRQVHRHGHVGGEQDHQLTVLTSPKYPQCLPSSQGNRPPAYKPWLQERLCAVTSSHQWRIPSASHFPQPCREVKRPSFGNRVSGNRGSDKLCGRLRLLCH